MFKIGNFFQKFYYWFHDTAQVKQLITQLAYENYLQSAKVQQQKRVLKNGYSVFSQSDEDGILSEIFRRIGIKHSTAVEFGLGDGLESNTLLLAMNGWKCWWFESQSTLVKKLKQRFSRKNLPLLTITQAHISSNNINKIFQKQKIPKEIDLLSIDIDSCDYWVWKGLSSVSPRVVVIEYNAEWGPDVAWTIPNNTRHNWIGDSNYGASLKALEFLANSKGYSLVGCSYSGVNAFFVRNDLTQDHFCQPFTSQNHWQPPREKLIFKAGKKRSSEPIVRIKG
ncbi:MAG: hypothetical protein ACOZAN_00680 [Patescibacteria group bacterium]